MSNLKQQGLPDDATVTIRLGGRTDDVDSGFAMRWNYDLETLAYLRTVKLQTVNMDRREGNHPIAARIVAGEFESLVGVPVDYEIPFVCENYLMPSKGDCEHHSCMLIMV